MAVHKAYGHNNLWSVDWNAVIFEMDGSIGISDDLINFWNGSIKKKKTATAI